MSISVENLEKVDFSDVAVLVARFFAASRLPDLAWLSNGEYSTGQNKRPKVPFSERKMLELRR